MLPNTMAHRFACCDHCPEEGCPRVEGHAAACKQAGCRSNESIFVDEDPITSENLELGIVADIAEWRHEQRITQMREDLIEDVCSIVGYESPGVRVLLRALSHPAIVSKTSLYFGVLDETQRCTQYEPPWTCAREAEAQYKNLQHGWLGAAGGIGFDESWCEPCRGKVMGT